MLNTAIVNLSLLQKNALNVKSKLKNSKLCAVVKANAYGHGAEMVANALYGIADSYAVALPEEGIALRLSGIKKDILVLIPPTPVDIALSIEYALTLSVENVRQISYIYNHCKQKNKKCKIHVKVNTGMNRLGVDNLADLKRLLDYCCGKKEIIIDGVFTHYGNPQDKKCFEKATEQFLLANALVKGYNNKVTAHASASGGFLQGAYFDMVRVGILLYGYLPFESSFSVSPIMKVYAPVVRDREVYSGQNFLYGDKIAKEPFSAGLVRFGYADGFSRESIQGQFNNRCMDVCLEKNAFNKKYFPVMTDAELLAKRYNTISYEILTKSTIRSQIIYTY